MNDDTATPSNNAYLRMSPLIEESHHCRRPHRLVNRHLRCHRQWSSRGRTPLLANTAASAGNGQVAESWNRFRHDHHSAQVGRLPELLLGSTDATGEVRPLRHKQETYGREPNEAIGLNPRTFCQHEIRAPHSGSKKIRQFRYDRRSSDRDELPPYAEHCHWDQVKRLR